MRALQHKIVHQQSQAEAPHRCIVEEQDPNRHADNLTNWTQEYDQLSGGHFYGRFDKSETPQIHVFKEFTSQSLRQQCRVWSDAVWFGFSLAGEGCRIDGQLTNPHTLMCKPGDQDFELVTPENFAIYGIVISQSLLQQFSQHEHELLTDSHSCRLQVPDAALRHVVRLQEQILDPRTGGASEQVGHDLLVNGLLELLQQPCSMETLKPSFQRRKAVVERVKSYLESHADKAVTIAELCQIACVSRRTLQYSFETTVGVSPLKYLRLTRLNQVRRMLSQADEFTTVSDTAANLGFWHAGQFGRDYKQLFAESPSATLARSRQSVR